MTKEKLQLLVPVCMTIGPDVNKRGANSAGDDEDEAEGLREDRGDALMKYAMLLADSDSTKQSVQRAHVDNIVRAIIEGETRVLVSGMTIEEIFGQRELFKARVYKSVQSELQQFGLRICKYHQLHLDTTTASQNPHPLSTPPPSLNKSN